MFFWGTLSRQRNTAVWGFEPLLVEGRWETTPRTTSKLEGSRFIKNRGHASSVSILGHRGLDAAASPGSAGGSSSHCRGSHCGTAEIRSEPQIWLQNLIWGTLGKVVGHKYPPTWCPPKGLRCKFHSHMGCHDVPLNSLKNHPKQGTLKRRSPDFRPKPKAAVFQTHRPQEGTIPFFGGDTQIGSTITQTHPPHLQT